MGFWSDFLPIFRRHTICFVEQKHETGDIYSFTFEPERAATWKAGQHGVFTFVGRRTGGKPFRAFSIATSPTEGVISIATRIGESPSRFKQALMELKKSDRMRMRGPIGSLYFSSPEKSLLMIAAGIGITPFRGILRYLDQNPNLTPKSVQLLYIARSDEYAFQEEFNSLNKKHDFFDVSYLTDRSQLMELAGHFADKNGNNAEYMVSGPPALIRGFAKLLRSHGISRWRIKSDIFLGY